MVNTSDGVLTWMEDEDYFEFSDDILLLLQKSYNLENSNTHQFKW